MVKIRKKGEGKKRRKKGEGKSEKEGEGGLGKQKSGVILWDEYDVNK